MAQACGRRRRGRGDKLVGEVCDAVDSARKHCLPLPTLPTCPPAHLPSHSGARATLDAGS